MNMIETFDSALETWPVPLPSTPVVAVLITLSTRDGSPLLAVDPRAGDAVAARLRHLHGPGHRVLAWSVLADRALCLVTAAGRDSAFRLVSHVVGRTTDDLLLLGHEQVWRWPAEMRLVRPDESLGDLVDHVLRAAERAGLAPGWRDWRWAGSRHWPDPERHVPAGLAPGLLWLDALTGDG